MREVCLFAGTSEGRELAELLTAQGIRVYACVATEYGETLLEERENLTVSAGRLDQAQMERLAARRFEALRDTGRIEFGEGILGKLIHAFCDAPELQQAEYEETLSTLQDLFYYYKNECADALSDDELIAALRLIYSERAHGSLDYLSGIDRCTLYHIAKTGSLAGTVLAGGEEDWDEA